VTSWEKRGGGGKKKEGKAKKRESAELRGQQSRNQKNYVKKKLLKTGVFFRKERKWVEESQLKRVQ